MDVLTLIAVAAGLLYGYYGRPTADPIMKWLKYGLIVSFACAVVFILAGSVFGIIGLALTTIVGGTVFAVLAASMVAWVFLFLLATAIGNQFHEGMDARMILFMLPLVALAYFLKLELTAILISLIAIAVFVILGAEVYLNYQRKLEDVFTKKTAVTLLAAFACVLCVMWVGNFGIFSRFAAVPALSVSFAPGTSMLGHEGGTMQVDVIVANTGIETQTVTVEFGIIPTPMAVSWFGDYWGSYSVITPKSEGQCCAGQENIVDSGVITLTPGQSKTLTMAARIPYSGIRDRCGSSNYYSAPNPYRYYSAYVAVSNHCSYLQGAQQAGYQLYDFRVNDFVASQANTITATSCSDSDNGRNLGTKGIIMLNGYISYDQDVCRSSTELLEFTCGTGLAGQVQSMLGVTILGDVVVASEAIPCPGGQVCSNGACIAGSTCGNGVCDAGETVSNCAIDCYITCDNDGVCDEGETQTHCPNDCHTVTCDSDGTCDFGETLANCPSDCSSCQVTSTRDHKACYNNHVYWYDNCNQPTTRDTTCGCGCSGVACITPCSTCDNDGACDSGETTANCPNDCHSSCDTDGVCDAPYETTASCPLDCKTCTPNVAAKCDSGNLYYYDSCGVKGSIAFICQHGCGRMQGEPDTTPERCLEKPPVCDNNKICNGEGEDWLNCPNDCPPPWYVFGVAALVVMVPILLYLKSRNKQ